MPLKKPRKFDREKAARYFIADVAAIWRRGNRELMEHLDNEWPRIAEHGKTTRRKASEPSPDDRGLINELLSQFEWLDNQADIKRTVAERGIATFEQAAKHAMSNLGIEVADFTLTNPRIRELIAERAEYGPLASRSYIERSVQHIISSFADLGESPYDKRFIRELAAEMDQAAEYRARAFALTETGIAAETAAIETYARNGVERKKWNATGRDTRPAHEEASGTVLAMAEQFVLDGHQAKHPLDPKLPPSQLVNCHCWLSPVVADDWDGPSRPWSGA